ncbi:MAG TPA: hypothetical protein VGD95_02495 [Micavibrio sp.]
MKPSFWRIMLLTGLMIVATPLPAAHAAAPAPATPATAQPATVAGATDAATTEQAAPPLHPLQVQINEIHQKFRRCASIQELSIRLNCYDNYAIELGYVTPDRAKADQVKMSKMGVWQVSTKVDGFGVSQTYLRTDSLNTISNKISERHVGFVIRCTPGKTEAFLDWKDPVVSGARAAHDAPKVLMNYTTNNGPKEGEDWDVSSDQQALFSPDPVAFIRKIMNKQTLTLYFAPAGTKAESARFNIEGLDTAINDVIVKACYTNGMTPNAPAKTPAAPQ